MRCQCGRNPRPLLGLPGRRLLMVKKRETKVDELREHKAVSRRDFVKAGAAAGLGAAGIVAAKRAHDLGAEVLVLEQNFEVGGKLSHNGGLSSFGGGDPVQERD